MYRLLFIAALLPWPIFAQEYTYFIEAADRAYYSQDFTAASLYYDSAFSVGEAEPLDMYNAACSNSLGGNKQKAIRQLMLAFQNGYSDFDWMYYDRDLDAIRNEGAYQSFESKHRPDSTIYFFDIIKDLLEHRSVDYYRMRVSLTEEPLSHYKPEDFERRLGMLVPVDSSETILAFSDRQLVFRECSFDDLNNRFNSLSNISLGGLIVQNCSGNLGLRNIDLRSFLLYDYFGKGNVLKNLKLDSVHLHGVAKIAASGSNFSCENSIFTIIDEPEEAGLRWYLDYEFLAIDNTVFSQEEQPGRMDPFMFDIKTGDLKITKTHFNHPTRFGGEATSSLNIKGNQFPEYMDFFSFKLPEFNCYIPFSQFEKTTFVGMMEQSDGNYAFRGDSIADYADQTNFDEMTSLYKRLYDNYRSRGDITSANSSYVRLKELEIAYLKMRPGKSQEDQIRLRINQIMGFYTDHATSPGKAILISFYILIAFAIFYFFFPSEWDKTSKPQLIADFRLFIEKNEHGYVKPFFKMVKGLLLSFVNAITLSLNAFVTLGFGSIPTTGIARYVCVLQGFIGWFLLSLFSVALINQVLF